jgi:pimeloyl-ACP methyl ester carboxylesterase
VPIILLPGVNREVARVLRGGSLAPFSGLALHTDRQAVAAVSDPRFPGDGSAAVEMPGFLDRELRGVAVRGLQPLVDRLVRHGGYVRGDPDRPRDKSYPENPPELRTDRSRAASLFVLYYDWRRDVTANACILADRVARVRAATGADRVLLVGHSLGGVIARYYLRYGGGDAVWGGNCPLHSVPGGGTPDAPGAEKVARAVFLGAPHRGSAQAFRALLEDFALFGVVNLGMRDAVVTMPVVWSMLPFPDADGKVPILEGRDGEEALPLFSLRTWTERGWLRIGPGEGDRLPFVEAMLARATGLQARMAGRQLEEERVRRLNVGSDCRPTLARALLGEGERLEFLGRGQSGHPLFARVTQPGDGVVSAESALGLLPSPTLTSLAVCSSHSGYLEDPAILERVVDFLRG